MEDKDRKVIVLKVKGKVPSVNDYLLPGLIKKKCWDKKEKKFKVKHIPTMYKSPTASKYQKWVINELRKSVTTEDREIIRSWKWYKVVISVVFNGGYMNRDADNIIKLTNDALFNNFLRVDDRFINSITSEKYTDEGNQYEYLIIEIMKNQDNRHKFGNHG